VPKKPPFSDIDLTRWRQYDHIYTDSLWLIDSRDKTGGHQLDYHGNFIPQIATQVFTRYTRKDDVVIDLFLGSGTSAIEAVRMGRRCIGVELKADLVEYVRTKLPSKSLGAEVRLLQGDSTTSEAIERVQQALASWGRSHAQLAILHPPYHDIIHFSDLASDLSNAPTVDAFLDRFEIVAGHAHKLLEPGRFCVLVIGDKYSKGELIPLGFWCLERMRRVGFRTKAIVVKNITGNERGKGRDTNLWRYRALSGGYYIFKHEYVIIFQKPAAAVDVRQELLKVRHMPPWSRAQDDEWDRASRFVYATQTLNELRRETRRVATEAGLPLRDFARYVLHRWYNFYTHQVVLDMVLAHPRTRPEPDPFHHTVDFYLGDKGFDLKLANLSPRYGRGLAYARAHPEDLARWLYFHQSGQGRFHAANRLFVVLHDAKNPDRTWELRRDFERLERAVHAFFQEPALARVEFADRDGVHHRPFAGVIFCVHE
jgi:16S rRNA G966 N2-methylase RsmD